MSIDGIYIYQAAGPSLLNFSINGSTPDYLHAKLNHISSESQRVEPAPVSSVVEMSFEQLIYVLKLNNLVVFAPFGTNTAPLVVEKTVEQFLNIARLHLGTKLTPQSILNNRATLVLILSEMLASGFPRITEPCLMDQLVPESDFLSIIAQGTNAITNGAGGTVLGRSGGLGGNSISSSSGGTGGGTGGIGGVGVGASSGVGASGGLGGGLAAGSRPSVLASTPWRLSNVTHAREELFIDIIEKVSVTSPRPPRPPQPRSLLRGSSGSGSGSGSGTKSSSSSSGASLSLSMATPDFSRSHSLHADISGVLRLNSLLSGTPIVHVTMSEAAPISSVGLHPCVDHQKFAESSGRQLSFTPPDGESVLATYGVSRRLRELPILSAQLNRVENSHCQLSVSTAIDRKVKEVSGLAAYIVFPPGTKSVKELSSTSGELNLTDPRRCELRFPASVPTGWNASLKIAGFDADMNVVQPLYVELRCTLVGKVVGDVNVKSVYIEGPRESFKGIRYQMEVSYFLQ